MISQSYATEVAAANWWRWGTTRRRSQQALGAMVSQLPRGYATKEAIHLTLAYITVASLSIVRGLHLVNVCIGCSTRRHTVAIMERIYKFHRRDGTRNAVFRSDQPACCAVHYHVKMQNHLWVELPDMIQAQMNCCAWRVVREPDEQASSISLVESKRHRIHVQEVRQSMIMLEGTTIVSLGMQFFTTSN